MTKHIFKILNSIPDNEINDFYFYMWGESRGCSVIDIKIHIVKYLKQFLINRRIFLKFNEKDKWIHSTIKATIIITWISEMNEKYCK